MFRNGFLVVSGLLCSFHGKNNWNFSPLGPSLFLSTLSCWFSLFNLYPRLTSIMWALFLMLLDLPTLPLSIPAYLPVTSPTLRNLYLRLTDTADPYTEHQAARILRLVSIEAKTISIQLTE